MEDLDLQDPRVKKRAVIKLELEISGEKNVFRSGCAREKCSEVEVSREVLRSRVFP